MKKQFTVRGIKFSVIAALLAIAGTALLVNGCNKSRETTSATQPTTQVNDALKKSSGTPLLQNEQITGTYTIANVRVNGGTTRVMFNQNPQIFTVSDAAAIATIKNAFANNQAVLVTFDPWHALVSQVSVSPIQTQVSPSSNNNTGTVMRIDQSTTDEAINHTALGVLNMTQSGLTPVIPDLATAQLMFDYIAHQCCALPGPYTVSYCITFQYAEDGCYARASKMCEIINNDYHYATQKLFSFAYYGNDELCVQAQKWGGCCINWWYHVAPLVTINTSTGPKAYIMDPAMFDQPVPVATWLHFQENPACVPGGDVPKVDVISIQPNSSYEPNGNPFSFNTDLGDVHADNTLTSYRHLTSCP